MRWLNSHFIPASNIYVLFILERSKIMNQDQIKGNIKQAAGEAQRKMGKAMDNDEHRVKGAEKEVEGKAQKDVGNVKDTFNK